MKVVVSDRTIKQKRLPVSAGVCALALAMAGSALWMAGMRSDSWWLIKGYGLGEIFLLVGGGVGILSAAKGDGRIAGLLAAGLCGLFVLWLFGITR